MVAYDISKRLTCQHQQRDPGGGGEQQQTLHSDLAALAAAASSSSLAPPARSTDAQPVAMGQDVSAGHGGKGPAKIESTGGASVPLMPRSQRATNIESTGGSASSASRPVHQATNRQDGDACGLLMKDAGLPAGFGGGGGGERLYMEGGAGCRAAADSLARIQELMAAEQHSQLAMARHVLLQV